MEGSLHASKKHTEIIEVVVVFPCVPEIQIEFLKAFVSLPRKEPLSIVSIPNSLAFNNSIFHPVLIAAPRAL